MGNDTKQDDASDWEQTDSDAAEIRELSKNGLVTVTETRKDEAYPVRYALTESGKHAYQIVSQVLVEQLLARPSGTAKTGTAKK